MLLGEPSTTDAVSTRPTVPSRSERWGLRHVPALDGLRGAAVVAVLLYHGGYLRGGYLGVDLFFVLSGYLITSLLLGEARSSGEINLPGFWARRMRRLFPALLLVLGGVAVYAALWARAVDLTTIRRDGLATLFYAANWSTIQHGTSYWDISLAPSPLQHTWSLAIEEQFYVVWPLVVVAIARWFPAEQTTRAVRNLCWVLAPICVALFVGLRTVFHVSATRVYEGTDTRAAALLLGAGWAAHRLLPAGEQSVTQRRRIELAGIAATVLLLLAWYRLDGASKYMYWGGLPFCSLLAAVVIVAVTIDDESSRLGRALSWRPLCAIGLISYGLYLWHWPIYQLFDEQRVHQHGLFLLGIRLAVTFAIAYVSYRFLEMPIRRGALRGRQAHRTIPLATAAAALAVVVATRGAIDTSFDPTATVDPVSRVTPGAPVVTIVGDSVAESLAVPVAEDPVAFGIDPRNRSWIGCSPLVEDYPMRQDDGATVGLPGKCHDLVLPGVRRDEPDLVLVVFGAGASVQMKIGGVWRKPCDPVYDQAWQDDYEAYLREIESTGAEIVVVTVPYRDARTSWGFNPTFNSYYTCENEGLTAAVAEVPHTHLLDLNELVCPDGPDSCKLELEGRPIRSDGLHFDKGEGGRLVAQWIVDHALDIGDVAPVFPPDST